MNIVMFTNVFKPFVGGVPISIDRLADGLRRNGHNVMIFAPEYPGDSEMREGVIRCKLLTFYKSERFDIPLTNIYSSKIKNTFANMDVDIVHVHHPFWMGALGVRLAHEQGVPAVFTYHTRYEEYLHIIPFTKVSRRKQRLIKQKALGQDEATRWKSYLKRKILPNHINKFLQKCDTILLPTESMKAGLSTGLPIRILPSGLDQDCYAYDEQKAKEIRKRYIGDKQYLLVTVSRITKEKNLRFMIGALHVLKQKQGDLFRLMLVGTGDQKESLNEYAKKLGVEDNIVFVGQVENNALSDYYRASDLFVFSSLTETQGIVLLEAMAQGLPVVAVDATGVRDIIENGVNGFLASQNKNQWALAAVRALQDESLKRGAEATAHHYDNTLIAKEAEGIYLETIRRTGTLGIKTRK